MKSKWIQFYILIDLFFLCGVGVLCADKEWTIQERVHLANFFIVTSISLTFVVFFESILQIKKQWERRRKLPAVKRHQQCQQIKKVPNLICELFDIAFKLKFSRQMLPSVYLCFKLFSVEIKDNHIIDFNHF